MYRQRILKKYIVLTVTGLFLLSAGEFVRARQSGPSNPAGSIGGPPSTGQRKLHPSPSPMDNSGNLVITGNVGSGKHFRGLVPYNSVTDFGAPLGSSTLNAFRRDSSALGIRSNVGQGYTPYYFDTRTVTKFDSDRERQLINPPQQTIDARLNDRITGENLRAGTQSRIRTDIGTAKPLTQRPLGTTKDQLETELSAELEKIAQTAVENEALDKTEKEFLEDEEFREKLGLLNDKAEKLKQDLVAEGERIQKAFRKYEKPEPKKQIEPGKEQEQKTPDAEAEEGKSFRGEEDIVDLMRNQIQQVLEQTGKAEELGIKEGKLYYDEEPVFSRLKEEEKEQPEAEQPEQENEETDEDSFMKRIEEISMTVAKSRTIMGEHDTFAAYSDDKFNKNMRAAEVFLKEGKYYRAADAYTLATIYKQDDPLAYAGKCHALFAAGEYMSSALFLQRTISMYPEYTALDINIEKMIGSRDVIDNRLLEIEDLYKNISKSPELMFLAGYVYHNIDRPEKAKESIDKAYEKMEDVPEVKLLRDVIYAVEE